MKSSIVKGGYFVNTNNSFIPACTVISAVWEGRGTQPFGETVNHHKYVLIALRFQYAGEGLRIPCGYCSWDNQLCNS